MILGACLRRRLVDLGRREIVEKNHAGGESVNEILAADRPQFSLGEEAC